MAQITDGAIYRFSGDTYLATLEDSELSGATMASFQRLPISQIDDEPSLFLATDSSPVDDAGNTVGTVDDLELIED